MQQLPPSQSTPAPDIAMLADIVSRVSNLFYEMMFVVDVNDGQISYISQKSGLAKMILTENPDVSNLPRLMRILGAVETEEFQQTLDIIKNHYNDMCPDQRSNLLFISDTSFHIGRLPHSPLTIKFAPITEDSNHSLNQLLCTLSLSSGTHPQTIQVLNTVTCERSYFDFHTKRWLESTSSVLSEIERHVLSLSAEGLSVPEISEIVCRAQDSVKSIRKRIFEKLGVENITEAIIFSTNYKII